MPPTKRPRPSAPVCRAVHPYARRTSAGTDPALSRNLENASYWRRTCRLSTPSHQLVVSNNMLDSVTSHNIQLSYYSSVHSTTVVNNRNLYVEKVDGRKNGNIFAQIVSFYLLVSGWRYGSIQMWCANVHHFIMPVMYCSENSPFSFSCTAPRTTNQCD